MSTIDQLSQIRHVVPIGARFVVTEVEEIAPGRPGDRWITYTHSAAREPDTWWWNADTADEAYTNHLRVVTVVLTAHGFDVGTRLLDHRNAGMPSTWLDAEIDGLAAAAPRSGTDLRVLDGLLRRVPGIRIASPLRYP